MTSPSRPRVEMKAKASGTPAKFEATPEKVIRAVAHDHRGSPLMMTGIGQQEARRCRRRSRSPG